MPIAIAIVSILGMSLGSFVNSCAYRLPRKISLIQPRSFCPNCHMHLSWFELVPILSYIALGGKCRKCQGKISIEYPVLELLVGSVTVVLFIWYGVSLAFLLATVFFLLMLLVALIDWNHLIIPNAIIVVGLSAGILLKTLSGYREIPSSLFSSLISSSILFIVLVGGHYFFRKDVMGMGDVKLAAAIGLFIGIENFLVSLWIASFVGMFYGSIILLIRGNRIIPLQNVQVDYTNKIPFGSFLSLASFVVFLLQDRIHSFVELWWTSIS